MQPTFVIVFHEVGQEPGSRARTRRERRVGGVVQLGKIRRQLVAVELSQRQAPEWLVFCRSAFHQTVYQPIVEAEQRVVIVTQCGFRRTG